MTYKFTLSAIERSPYGGSTGPRVTVSVLADTPERAMNEAKTILPKIGRPYYWDIEVRAIEVQS